MHGHDVIPQIQQQSYFYGVSAPLAKDFQPAARCSWHVAGIARPSRQQCQNKELPKLQRKGSKHYSVGENSEGRDSLPKRRSKDYGARKWRGRRLAAEAPEEREQRLQCERDAEGGDATAATFSILFNFW